MRGLKSNCMMFVIKKNLDFYLGNEMNQGHKISSLVLNRVAKRTIFVLTNAPINVMPAEGGSA